ncbi:hypothetical protein LCGC14_1288230 [marine sediment metagenome]|uniref:Phage terminase large subunit N-terminal domain-containing protein n=1 Tax=marine sediment metagenome TaxID=412755 RepID=A0A0F9LE76_9ZZZZ
MRGKTRTQEDIKHDIDVILSQLGHTLSPEQQAIVYCTSREVLGGGGERAGKSYIASDYLNVRFWEGDLFWITGKDYDRCHSEFEYTAEAMIKLSAVRPENISTPKNGQWSMKLETGGIIKTWSLKDWLKVGSEAPDGIIICEVAQIALQEYRRICDRTAEKRGWVCGTGTFEGSLGWYPETWKLYQLPDQQGQSFSLPSWSNRVVYPGGYDDDEIQRLKANYSIDYFNERFGGIPSPPHGLVFPEFRYLTHVKDIPLTDNPLYLWIDPGYAGSYAVEVIQMVNDTVCIVDEIYERGLVTEQIIDICLQKSWWSKVAGGVVDIAAKQHQAMPAVAEVWASKAKLNLQSNMVSEDAGRERLHTFLTVNPIDHQPRLLIDPKCVGILSEFGVCPNPFSNEAEPYKWKEDRVGKVIGRVPDDKNNHGIKAVIYGLVNQFGYVNRNSGKARSKRSIYFGQRRELSILQGIR